MEDLIGAQVPLADVEVPLFLKPGQCRRHQKHACSYPECPGQGQGLRQLRPELLHPMVILAPAPNQP